MYMCALILYISFQPFRLVSNFFKWLLVEAFLVILNIFNCNEYTYAASFHDVYDYGKYAISISNYLNKFLLIECNAPFLKRSLNL